MRALFRGAPARWARFCAIAPQSGPVSPTAGPCPARLDGALSLLRPPAPFPLEAPSQSRVFSRADRDCVPGAPRSQRFRRGEGRRAPWPRRCALQRRRPRSGQGQDLHETRQPKAPWDVPTGGAAPRGSAPPAAVLPPPRGHRWRSPSRVQQGVRRAHAQYMDNAESGSKIPVRSWSWLTWVGGELSAGNFKSHDR